MHPVEHVSVAVMLPVFAAVLIACSTPHDDRRTTSMPKHRKRSGRALNHTAGSSPYPPGVRPRTRPHRGASRRRQGVRRKDGTTHPHQAAAKVSATQRAAQRSSGMWSGAGHIGLAR